MKWDGIYLDSVETYLPCRVSLERIQRDITLRNPCIHFESITVSEQPGHVMAGIAAKKALKNSAHAHDRLDSIIYAQTFCSNEHMVAATHVQRVLRQPEALAVELNAASNGAMAGLEVIARLLATSPHSRAGMISAASRVPEGTDRLLGGTVNGDGAVAAVLSRSGGFARLLVNQRNSNPEFEKLYRRRATASTNCAVDQSPGGIVPYAESLSQEISLVINRTLTEAEITMPDIAHVIVPAFPLTVLKHIYLDRNSIPLEKTCWSELRKNGHVGPCDQLLGLSYLIGTNKLTPGELVLMIGAGVGFQFSCLLLEIVQPSRPAIIDPDSPTSK